MVAEIRGCVLHVGVLQRESEEDRWGYPVLVAGLKASIIFHVQ